MLRAGHISTAIRVQALSTGGTSQAKLSSANEPRHRTNPSQRRRLFSAAS